MARDLRRKEVALAGTLALVLSRFASRAPTAAQLLASAQRVSTTSVAFPALEDQLAAFTTLDYRGDGGPDCADA